MIDVTAEPTQNPPATPCSASATVTTQSAGSGARRHHATGSTTAGSALALARRPSAVSSTSTAPARVSRAAAMTGARLSTRPP